MNGKVLGSRPVGGWKNSLVLAVICMLLATTASTSLASQPYDAFAAYEEFEAIQAEQGGDAAIAYLESLPEPLRTDLYTGMTTVNVVHEPGTVEFAGTKNVISSVDGRALLASCWQRTDSVLGESAWFSANLWRYYVTTYWCGDGYLTTSGSQYTSHAVYNALWWYEGNSYVGVVVGGCVGCPHVQLQSEGIFAAELPAFGTIQKLYPWVKATGYGNGMSVAVTS